MSHREKDIATLVRAIRPNAKAVRSGLTAGKGFWAIIDGDEIISITSRGRRHAWHSALSFLRKEQSTGD
jgi:hypothetical protein